MSETRRTTTGVWVRIDEVAACYEVEVTWVREVRDAGLLETRLQDDVELVPVLALDRLAEVVRLARALGLDLGTVSSLL